MYCLNIVGMIVPPGSTHAFRILVVRNDVVGIGELFMADCAYAGLLPNLAVQQIAHFRR